MKKRALILVIAFIFSVTSTASSEGFDHTHSVWDALLKENVYPDGAKSSVDYESFKVELARLDGYLGTLEALSREEFDKFTSDQQLALLINAYNAFTVKLIVSNYPVKSIKDIGSVLSSPWKKKFFTMFGKKRHLDYIEHDIIRKEYNEPRIHFALVCAAISCPALRNEAYTAKKLRKQLEDGGRKFLNDTDRNRYDAGKNKLYLSKIFDWFGGDFKERYDSVKTYAVPRIKAVTDRKKAMEADVDYIDYDWSLNKVS